MKYFFGIKILSRLFFFSLILLVGCQFNPYASDFTIEPLKREDVTGTYELEYHRMSFYDEQFDALVEDLDEPPTITLNLDGTFGAEFLPVWKEKEDKLFYYEFFKFANVSGNWVFDIVASVSNGKPELDQHYGLHFAGAELFATNSPGFIGNQKPYQLIFQFGDHDHGDVMIFEQIVDE